MKATQKSIRMPGFKNGNVSLPTATFAGDIADYKFSTVQEKNYQAIAKLLAKKGIVLTQLFASTYTGAADYISRYGNPNKTAKLTKFVAVAGPLDAPVFVWYKYEGDTAGGGANHVFFNGQKEKVTDFIAQGWKRFK